jgi:hypothetical protein
MRFRERRRDGAWQARRYTLAVLDAPRRWVFRCDPFLIADARAVAGTAGLIAGVRMQHRAAPYNDAQNQDRIHGFKRN